MQNVLSPAFLATYVDGRVIIEEKRPEAGGYSSFPVPSELPEAFRNDARRMKILGFIEDYMAMRRDIAEKFLADAEKECPWKPGDLIELVKPWRKKFVGRVTRISTGWMDFLMIPETPWMVRVAMLKNDGTESVITTDVVPDNIKGRARIG